MSYKVHVLGQAAVFEVRIVRGYETSYIFI